MREGASGGDRLAMVLSFSSFFVFPAIPAGRSGAITFSDMLAAGLIVLWLPRLRTSEWWPAALLLAPIVLSAWSIVMAGTAVAPSAVMRSVAAEAMSLMVMVPTLRLLRDGHGEAFLLGAACAILVHVAMGAYQVFAFDRLEFPFIALMNTNPSQALLAEDPATYAEYVKRPFGLFAEPSAMTACIGPWLVVITSALLSPHGLRGRLRRSILALALGGGLWLAVKSRSGMSAAIVGGTAVTALAAALAWRRSVGGRTVGLAAAAVMAVASAVWLSQNAAARFDLAENQSWRARLDSIMLVTHILSPPTGTQPAAYVVTGLGPGQSYSAVNTTQLKYQTGGNVTAVWSIGLNYALENGLLAVAALLSVLGCAAWSIWTSRQRVAGAAFMLVWLTGIFVATSYFGQPALWTGLAALLSWRFIAP